MDWLFRYRWPVGGGLVVVIALASALAVLASDREPDAPVEAAGTASTTSTTSTASTAPATSTDATTTTSDATTTTTAPPTTPVPTTAVASTPTPGPSAAAVPTTTTATTTTPPPPYRASIETVTAAQLGSSWTPGRGCTPADQLRAVNVTHWGYDGAVHQGRLIVAASQADNVAAIFGDLYTVGFPIQRIVPVDRYGADDGASMRANNTSGYNCRTVAGTDTLSNHAYGQAIDVNPLHNPYVKGSTVDPPEGRPWADRSRQDPGMIHAGDAVVEAFSARGWSWGGYWTSPDYQHFDI